MIYQNTVKVKQIGSLIGKFVDFYFIMDKFTVRFVENYYNLLDKTTAKEYNVN